MLRHPDPAIESILNQFDRTFKLLRRSIECFNPEQWIAGISQFEVPWKVAYHTLQCLLYYFRTDPDTTYRQIPAKYGKEWWELPETDAPDQAQILDFLAEVDELVKKRISVYSVDELSDAFPGHETVMGNIIYAMRHTMHHQGGLNILSVHHKIDVDLWDSGD